MGSFGFDRKSFWLLLVLSVLNVLDVVSTLLCLRYAHAHEANPLVVWVLAHFGKTGFVVYKVGMMSLLVAVGSFGTRRAGVFFRRCLYVVTLFYVLTVVNNFYIYFFVLGRN